MICFLATNSGDFMTPPDAAGPDCRCALIQIKVGRKRRPRLSAIFEPGELFTMPRDTAIVIAGIVIAFAVFAIVLAWADFYTNKATPPGDAQ
jgi:hypothetical protein